MRAAIYARYSTELQDARSIEDQVHVCRDHAQRRGFQVVATFADKALSGGSLLLRTGIRSLMDAAHRGEFDVVIVEALDRLARDMEDLAGLYKRLSFRNIAIEAVYEGTATTILVGLRGLVGQLAREDNVHKIRRGLQGRVRDGRSAGGSAYGYRPDPARKGDLLVDVDEQGNRLKGQ